MVTVGADLKKCDFVAQGDVKTHFLKYAVHIGVEDCSPILGAAHDMVQKNRNIVALANERTHALR